MSNLAQLLDTIARLQNKAVQIDDLHRIVVGKNGSSAGKFRTNPDAGQAMQATTLQLDKILVRRVRADDFCVFEYCSTALVILPRCRSCYAVLYLDGQESRGVC